MFTCDTKHTNKSQQKRSTVTYRVATFEDIPQILTLHARYQVDTISEHDKKDGFITTAFSEAQLTELIRQEKGLFVATRSKLSHSSTSTDRDEIVAYVMAASWQFWSQWPMFAYMIQNLHKTSYAGYQLNTTNSYQYGPICVDKSVRGNGVFEGIFQFSREQMSTRFPVLITFINKINPRSFAAHTKKVNLDVINEFEYNNNQYYELACLTRQ